MTLHFDDMTEYGKKQSIIFKGLVNNSRNIKNSSKCF